MKTIIMALIFMSTVAWGQTADEQLRLESIPISGLTVAQTLKSIPDIELPSLWFDTENNVLKYQSDGTYKWWDSRLVSIVPHEKPEKLVIKGFESKYLCFDLPGDKLRCVGLKCLYLLFVTAGIEEE
jgi:hypothetical protein